MRPTRVWRTTSSLVRRTKSMSSMSSSTRVTSCRPLAPLRQVDLRDVAGDDHLRAEPEPRQEHLHLLGRRVLGLVEHDERVVEGATAHVRERRDLDRARREQLRHELGIHHLVERVVQRAQVRVDLVGERAGQESEPLPRLDRRAAQDDAARPLCAAAPARPSPSRGRSCRCRQGRCRTRSCAGRSRRRSRFWPRVFGRMLLPRLVRIAWLSTSARACPGRRSRMRAELVTSVGAEILRRSARAPGVLRRAGARACGPVRRAAEGDLVAAHVAPRHPGYWCSIVVEQPILRTEQSDHRDAVDLQALLVGAIDGVVAAERRDRVSRRQASLPRGRPHSTCACTWKIVWPALAPVLKTSRNSPSACSVARRCAVDDEFGEQVGIARGELDDVGVLLGLREHHEVHGRLGGDVVDRDDPVGLGDDRRGDLTGDDAAEDGGFGHAPIVATDASPAPERCIEHGERGGASGRGAQHGCRRVARGSAPRGDQAFEFGGCDAALGTDDQREVAPVGFEGGERRGGASARARASACPRVDGEVPRSSRPAPPRARHDRIDCLLASRTIEAQRSRPFSTFGALPARDRPRSAAHGMIASTPSSVAACTASSSRSPLASACASQTLRAAAAPR